VISIWYILMSISHKDRLQKLTSQTNYLRIELEQVRKQLRLIDDLSVIDLRELTAKNTHLENQLSNIRVSHARMEQATRSMAAEKQSLTRTLQDLNSQLSAKDTRLQEITAQVNDISSEYARLHELLTASLSEEEYEPQQRLNELNQEYEDTETEIHEKLSLIKDLRQKTESLKYDIEDLKWDFQELEEMKEEVNRLKLELDSGKEILKELEESYAEKTTKNKEIGQEIDQLRETNHYFLTTVHNIQTHINELNATSLQIPLLENERLSLNTTREKLIHEMNERMNELTSQQDLKLKLKEDLTSVTIHHDTLAQTLLDLSSNKVNHDSLSQLILSKHQLATDLEQRVTAKSFEISSKTENVAQLASNLQDLQSSIYLKISDNSNLSQSLASSINELKLLRSSYESLEATQEAECCRVTNEVSSLAITASETSLKFEELQASSEFSKKSLELEKAVLEQKLIEIHERISELESDLINADEIRARNEFLQRELEEQKRLNIEYESAGDSSIEILEENLSE
jgi:chromosome segregation ATPase